MQKKNDYKEQENTKGRWRGFRQKCIPGDTDGFRKFKETTKSVEQELKRERSIHRKSGLKKKKWNQNMGQRKAEKKKKDECTYRNENQIRCNRKERRQT